MNKIICFLIQFGSLLPLQIFAQDIDSLMNSLGKEKTVYTTATFKSTRIINGQSIERMKANNLDFRIHHRFGQLNTGSNNLWGLDQSNVFFSLEYGITDWLMIGAGRTTYQKTFNTFAKFSVLRQSKGLKNMPVSLSAYIGMDDYTTKWDHPKRTNYYSSRLSYIYQILVARKFTESLSLQLSPTMIHSNLVQLATDNNDGFAMGLGGRFKLSKSFSVNAEYFYSIQPNITGVSKKPNSLSFGVDIETGGHVFQIMLTNSQPMIERGFIRETTGRWKNGDIHLGFNISRVFTFKK
jgi:hypothetical protein